MILELNARPGLAIQLANREGLRPRLDKIEAWLADQDEPPDFRVACRVRTQPGGETGVTMFDPHPIRGRALLGIVLATSLVAGAPARGADDVPHYEMIFEARVIPTQRIARASWTVGVGAKALRELNLAIDPERHFEFKGDGEVTVEDDTVTWKPPIDGGSLRYGFRIDDIRRNGGYDARITEGLGAVPRGRPVPGGPAPAHSGMRTACRSCA